MEHEMADPRQENKFTQKAEETVRQTGEHAAEQTTRVGLAVAKAGEDMSQGSAELLQQNAEMLQKTWRSGMETATAMIGRSSDELNRTLGFTGDEAQKATEKSVRNTHAVLNSVTAVSKGMNEISREYFEFVRRQMESNMDRMNELWRCRTPHEFVALQSELAKETVTKALENGRRLADMSLKVAEDAGKRITEGMQRAA
jgi:phasin family protein